MNQMKFDLICDHSEYHNTLEQNIDFCTDCSIKLSDRINRMLYPDTNNVITFTDVRVD